MAEAKTRFRTTPLKDPAKSDMGKTSDFSQLLTPHPESGDYRKAKAMVEQGVAKITENVVRYGYKEDKVALTLLNGALELL